MARKRQKTSHNQHSHSKRTATNGNNSTHDNDMTLTHEEMWDDSLLVNSWNEALKEYELYHSIHARGEDVETILAAAELEEKKASDAHWAAVKAASSTKPPTTKSNAVDDDADEDETPDEAAPQDGQGTEAAAATDDGAEQDVEQQRLPGNENENENEKAMHVPSDLLPPPQAPQPHDDALQNVKMAYYWAGYYSGVYDSQRAEGQGSGS